MVLVKGVKLYYKIYGQYEVFAFMYFTSTIITIIFIDVYKVLFLFNNIIYVFLLYDYVFSLYIYV